MKSAKAAALEPCVKLLMERLLARLDSPEPPIQLDNLSEPLVVDEEWSLFEVMHPDEFEKSAISAATLGMSTPECGTKPITIRVPNRVVSAFRRQSAKTGTGYQTLMNRALREAADSFG